MASRPQPHASKPGLQQSKETKRNTSRETTLNPKTNKQETHHVVEGGPVHNRRDEAQEDCRQGRAQVRGEGQDWHALLL